MRAAWMSLASTGGLVCIGIPQISLIPLPTQSGLSGNNAPEKTAQLPMTRNQLAAIDFVRGFTLKQIMFKHGYPDKGTASKAIRTVLTREQMDERNRRLGRYYGVPKSEKKLLKSDLRTKRIASMKNLGMGLKEIAEIERIHPKTVCHHLRKAKTKGLR